MVVVRRRSQSSLDVIPPLFILERPTDDLFDVRAPSAMTGTTIQIPDCLLIQLNVHTHVPNYTHAHEDVGRPPRLVHHRRDGIDGTPRRLVRKTVRQHAWLTWSAQRDQRLASTYHNGGMVWFNASGV